MKLYKANTHVLGSVYITPYYYLINKLPNTQLVLKQVY